jgi:hypothetical protein
MICNVASDLSTKQLCWTVSNRANGRFIQCVPAHQVALAMRQLTRPAR